MELAVERKSEAGEPTGAREHVCGPGVILTTSVKARVKYPPGEARLRSKSLERCARVKIMLVGCPQTAGQASRSGEGLIIGRRGESRRSGEGLRPPPPQIATSMV